MTSVKITELHQYLPDYLKQLQQGEEIAITSHGKTIAHIVPDRHDDKCEATLKRLTALRDKMLVGDILAPLDEEWTSDTDNLQEVKQQQDLRGQVDIADNWQVLRELEINK